MNYCRRELPKAIPKMRFLGRKFSNSGPKAICRRILNKFIPSADRRSRYGREDDGRRLAIPTKVSVVGGAHYHLMSTTHTRARTHTHTHARTHTHTHTHTHTRTHTQLIKFEEVDTSNYVSLVELATTTVKNRQNKKCHTTLMISDTSVELLINKLVSLILLMCVQKLKFTYSQKLFTVGLDQVVTCFSLPSEPRAFALVYKKDGAGGYCCASLMLNDALTSLTVCSLLGWIGSQSQYH